MMNIKIITTATGIIGSALMWLISFKIVALLFGPSGVAIYSQFRQIMQTTGTAATFGGGSTIVQGLSERVDIQQRQSFRASINVIVFCLSTVIAFVTFILSRYIAVNLLTINTENAVNAIQLLSIGIFFNAGTMYNISILNGYQFLKPLAIAQIVLPAMIVLVLASLPHISSDNFLITLTYIFSGCTFFSFIISYSIIKKLIINQKNNQQFLSKTEMFEFIKFSSATLIAALSSSITMLLIRAQIISTYGTHQAGLFDASWTLTFNYVTLFLTACSILYLPRLSQAKSQQEQKYYLQSTTYIVIACVTLITYIIVIFKVQLLHIFYTKEFYAAEKSLHILASAILVRSVSWVLSMLLVATKDSITIVKSELFFNGLLISFTLICTYNNTVSDAISWGFLIANIIYFLWIIYCTKQKNTLLESKSILILISISVIFILAAYLMEYGNVDKMPLPSKTLLNIILASAALIIIFISHYRFQKINNDFKLYLNKD